MNSSSANRFSKSSIPALITATVFLIAVAGLAGTIVYFVMSRNTTDAVDKYPKREMIRQEKDEVQKESSKGKDSQPKGEEKD